MIDKADMRRKIDEIHDGQLVCLDAAVDLANRIEPGLPPGWGVRYDPWSEGVMISNAASKDEDPKSVEEFKLLTRIVSLATGVRPDDPDINGTEDNFDICRCWTIQTQHPGMWGSYTVQLRIYNPNDCKPNVRTEEVKKIVQHLSLGDVCLGFKGA